MADRLARQPLGPKHWLFLLIGLFHRGLLCAGHTITARAQVDGFQVRPLATTGGAR